MAPLTPRSSACIAGIEADARMLMLNAPSFMRKEHAAWRLIGLRAQMRLGLVHARQPFQPVVC